MADEISGTNPDSEFTSAESIVESMLSRPEGDNEAESTSEEAGNQTTERGKEDPSEDAADTAETSEPVTKPVAEKPVEEAKFELPKQQDKDYPKEVKAHYAKRYGTTLEEAEKNPALAAAIKQSIDKDIYIEQLKAKDAEGKAATEAAAKSATESSTAAKPAEGVKPTTQEFLASLDKDVEAMSDPEVTKAFKSELWKAFANVDAGTPEGEALLKERGIDPDAPVKMLTKFGLNLARTAATQAVEAERAMFDQRVEQAYPGLGKMYHHALRSEVWDGVRGSDESFKGLPEYNSPEFTKTVDDVLEKNPWVDQLAIPGKSPQEVMQAKYAIVARIASGERVKPADVAQAAESGRKQGAEAARNVARAKLDSGRTAGNSSSGKSEESEFVSAYRAKHSSL